MALWDGPLFIGPNSLPLDANTSAADIYQIQSGGAVQVHSEVQANHRIGFLDGHYWAADGKVYIVGGYQLPLSGWSDGAIWTWDGNTLTLDHVIPGAAPNDNFVVTTIEEFNGALYVGQWNILGGVPTGGFVLRKSAPGAPWTQVQSFIGPGGGPVYLKASGGQLVVVYDSIGAPLPASFYSSPTGDPASWIPEPWFNPAPNAEPRLTFYNGVEWVHCFAVPGFPATFETWFAPALGGPWAGPTVFIFKSDCGRAYKGPANNWYVALNNDPTVYVYAGAGAWVPFRVEAFPIGAAIVTAPCDGGAHESSVYIPMYSAGIMSYAIDAAPSIPFPDPVFFNPAAFISTPTTPPVWDVLDIEPADWAGAPLCDQAATGTVTYGATYLSVVGDLGVDTRSRYELYFGGCRPGIPDDWDMQIDMELTSIPRLHSFNEDRILVLVGESNTNRMAGITISQQGIGFLEGYQDGGTDTYGRLDTGAAPFIKEGDSVTLKITGLGTDAQDRAYLSLQTPQGIYRAGFELFEPPVAVSTEFCAVEAAGKGGDPVEVRVGGWRMRTHSYDPADAASIDNTKPQAVIT